jgi:hypothetical protein
MERSADNRMVLNDSKTKVMLVTGKHLDFEWTILRMNLSELDVFNLLGLKIDSLLTFDQHVESYVRN